MKILTQTIFIAFILLLNNIAVTCPDSTKVELGIILNPENSITTPGEIKAAETLADLVKKCPSAKKVQVSWTDQFPSGYKVPQQVIYYRLIKTLVITFTNTGVKNEYKPVSDENIYALAANKKEGFTKILDFGAKESIVKKTGDIPTEQKNFKKWLLENTSVIDVHFESDWQIWLRLSPDKYTTKENVEQIAETIARWYANKMGKKLSVCTVWNYSGNKVFAKGRYSSN